MLSTPRGVVGERPSGRASFIAADVLHRTIEFEEGTVNPPWDVALSPPVASSRDLARAFDVQRSVAACLARGLVLSLGKASADISRARPTAR